MGKKKKRHRSYCGFSYRYVPGLKITLRHDIQHNFSIISLMKTRGKKTNTF